MGSKQQLQVQLLYYDGFDMWVLLGEHYCMFKQHVAELIQYPFNL